MEFTEGYRENCWEGRRIKHRNGAPGDHASELLNYLGRVIQLERTSSDSFLCPFDPPFKIQDPRLIMPSVGEDVEKLELSYNADGNVN